MGTRWVLSHARWRRMSFFMLGRAWLISLMQMSAASERGRQMLLEGWQWCVENVVWLALRLVQSPSVCHRRERRSEPKKGCVEVGGGGDFLFIRALALEGFAWNLCHREAWCKTFSSHSRMDTHTSTSLKRFSCCKSMMTNNNLTDCVCEWAASSPSGTCGHIVCWGRVDNCSEVWLLK